MVVATDTSPVCDVVFVVEGTAALGGYFEALKASYILPALEHFNGGPPDEIDYGCDYSCTLYSLVVFRASDCIPEPTVTCFEPTTSTHKFIETLDDISFNGGAGEACSHVAEGLSRALLVFDDMKAVREPNTVNQRHCILVCNSPPYNVPASESPGYTGLLSSQLASKCGDSGINFSVMSPRKIPVLFKLFEDAWQASREPMVPPKNFTTDSRHLVLLKGFTLQERPASPGQKKDDGDKHDSNANRASQPSPSLQDVMDAVQAHLSSKYDDKPSDTPRFTKCQACRHPVKCSLKRPIEERPASCYACGVLHTTLIVLYLLFTFSYKASSLCQVNSFK